MDEISIIMSNTLSSDYATRTQAEQQLNTIVLDVNNLEGIFKYIADPNRAFNLKQAAAIFLMRYVQDFWLDDTEKALEIPQKVLSLETKSYFQQNIINLMFFSNIDTKLLPVLMNAIIALCTATKGYINAWPDLMNVLSKVLKTKNLQISLFAYDMINKVIKRYRSEMKSRALYTEIIVTIQEIAAILTEDGITCINFFYSDERNKNRDACLLYLNLLNHIINIFYSLNSQDFPEFFEDNLNSWMAILRASIDFTLNITDVPMNSLFLKVKKSSMKSLNLYCNNYYEDFSQFHNDYYASVWSLVQIIKHEQHYEKLIKELLVYYKILFQFRRCNLDSDSITLLINNLIIPEMRLTGKELDDFEDNPINFLKVELEESDMDSNKYHAINLLKTLLENYPNLKNDYINPLINKYLNSYYENPRKNWMDKIVAINLIFATMIKIFAQRIGATEVTVTNEELSNLIQTIFIKEFTELTNNSVNLTRAYSLKFLSMFRLQIPGDWMTSTINMLVGIINNSDQVTQTAALLALEKILFMRESSTNANIKAAVNTQETFIELITCLVKLASTMNQFAMRCLFRTVFLTSDDYYKFVIENLSISINDIIKAIIANPSEDQFNYYLFETIVMLMKKLNSVDRTLYDFFEQTIKENLVYIMQNFITDLVGYTIQVLALHLQFFQGDPMADNLHKNILSTILFNEGNWSLSMKYLFNPFSTYLKNSLLKSQNHYMTNKESVEAIFKIIHKLLEMKTYNVTFDLIDRVINTLDLQFLMNHIKNLFFELMCIFNNLKENNKKAYREFCRILLTFLCKLMVKSNSKFVVDLIESVSQGLTMPLLMGLSEYLVDVETKYKKLATYAICTFLTDFCSSFDLPTLKFFSQKLVEHLEKFTKTKLSIYCGGIDKLMEGNDLSYAANNYNKLVNAEIKLEIEAYTKYDQVDENQLFIATIQNIKRITNYDLIAEIYNDLKDREKEFVNNLGKK